MKKPPKDTPETTLAKTVVPKPSQREVIEGMAILQREKLIQERNDIAHKKATLGAEIKKEMVEYLRSNIASITAACLECHHEHYSTPEIHVDLINLPASTKRKIEAHKQIDVPHVPDLSIVRHQIRARVLNQGTTDERVAKLVTDPVSKAALEEMLAVISRPATPALPDSSSK